MNIYQISTELQNIFHGFDENYDENGEITEKCIQKIESLQCSMEQKCISFGSYILNVEAEYKAIEEAEKSIKKRRERLEKKSKDLRSYLQLNMERCGINEIKGSPYFILKLKKNPVSVFIKDEALIGNEFKKVREVISIDKSKIRDEIIAGRKVLGAELIQNNRLEIK
jgi:hypothetical protein